MRTQPASRNGGGNAQDAVAFDAWDAALGPTGRALLASSGQTRLHSIHQIDRLLDDWGVARVLLVVDRQAVAAAAVGGELRLALRGVDLAEFDAFSPNPTGAQAAAAARLAGAHRADAVVAVGGGSCLDVAKLAALGARHPQGSDEGSGHGPTPEPLPILAVPTTSGTGSEATHFAAIYVDGRKTSVAHRRLRPRAAVLDLRLHVAMPAPLAAATGLDAAAQAMESLWAVGSDEESRRFALAAGPLVAANLEASVRHGGADARRGMALAAHFAGHAINLSKTTAAHALSYALTQRHGLAHGHAVGLLVGPLAAFNAGVADDTCLDPRGAAHVRAAVGEAAAAWKVDPADLPRRFTMLLESLGLPSTLRAAGVREADLPSLAAAVDPVRLANNPRRLAEADLEAVLRRAF